MNDDFLKQRIQAAQAHIIGLEKAIDAILSDEALVSYTMDTGQSKVTVTRADLASLNRQLDAKLELLQRLQSMGGVTPATTVGVPGY